MFRKRLALGILFIEIFFCGVSMAGLTIGLTIDQCKTSIQSRANLYITRDQISQLCENHPQAVVDCTIRLVLTHPLTKKLPQALKDCQRDFIRYIR